MQAVPADTTVEMRVRALFEAAGAQWIELPVLYPEEPFLETAGEDIRRRMFVTEGRRGERLALRPDFTIPVCLHHLRRAEGAERYAYGGLVFRRHDQGAPERLETGCEDLGRPDRMAADAEMLALAVAAAQAVAPGGLDVRLGDIGLFTALLDALGLPDPWCRKLRRSFGLPQAMDANLARLSAPRGAADLRLDAVIRRAADQHDRQALMALLEDRLATHGHAEAAGRTAAEIADRFLNQRALAESHIESERLTTLRSFLALQSDLADAGAALGAFSTRRRVEFGAALRIFLERADAITSLVSGATIRFEAGFGRPLDYYTGMVFEARAAGQAQPIFGGGRYDKLMELLGAPKPVAAVGFTMRLDLARGERGA